MTWNNDNGSVASSKKEPLLETAESNGGEHIIVPPHLRNMVDPSPNVSPAASNVGSVAGGSVAAGSVAGGSVAGRPAPTGSTPKLPPSMRPPLPPQQQQEAADADAQSYHSHVSKDHSKGNETTATTGMDDDATIGTLGRLKLPGSVKNLWSDFRNKNEDNHGADGFVLIDRSQFAPPEKVRAQRTRPTTPIEAFFYSLPPWVRTVTIGAGAMVLILLLSFALAGTPVMQSVFDTRDGVFVNWEVDYNVAFIGNSYLYVNDVPRLMESISEGHITQNSCINTAGSLGKLLRAGNGMYERWNSDAAVLRTGLNSYYDFIDEDYVLYDYGACTVYQLLEGYDNDLVYQNYNGAYYDDGTNPCFVDDYYLGLLADRLSSNPYYWDFVVLNDQTKRMAFEDAREESIDALKYAYAPMIRDSRAVPIIVDTHAFWTEQGNMTGLGDIAYFTAEIYEGLREYVLALKYNLPDKLAPRVAPVGLAFLTIYEERNDLWERLFLSDQIHASPHGSYLTGCVLYATIYGHLPHSAGKLGGVEGLFSKARNVQDAVGYPTNREANYLRTVAKRVALHGHIPKSLKIYQETQFNLNGAAAESKDEAQYYWNGMDRSWEEDDAEETQEEVEEWNYNDQDWDNYDYNNEDMDQDQN